MRHYYAVGPVEARRLRRTEGGASVFGWLDGLDFKCDFRLWSKSLRYLELSLRCEGIVDVLQHHPGLNKGLNEPRDLESYQAHSLISIMNLGETKHA